MDCRATVSVAESDQAERLRYNHASPSRRFIPSMICPLCRESASFSVMRIWTIGHWTRAIDEFISLLKENEIKLLADVRAFPGSKRYPQSTRTRRPNR